MYIRQIVRHVINILILFFVSTNVALAGTENHSISINGMMADRTVTEVSFDNDNVVLHWNDNTSTSNKMAQTMANLAADDNSDVDKWRITSISGIYQDHITIDGVEPGTRLSIYDVQGDMLINDKAITSSCVMNISKLNTGIYILKTNEEVIRFIKQ